MLCSACGTDNDAGRRFCDTCGAPLTVVCRVCGSANRPTARFCGDCGTALEGGGAPGAAAPRPAVIESALTQPERRLVSVLFVDLVGYTTLADGWDPEQARDLLTRYFEMARDIVGRYGGTIEKFIGDAVMAVWGAPTATRTTPSEPSVRRWNSWTACRAWSPRSGRGQVSSPAKLPSTCGPPTRA